eukprot:gene30552-36923_t
MAAKEIQVYLNIYDIHASNSLLGALGGGFYHTGVEIDGYEYSFSPSGVSRTSPRLDSFGQLKEHLLMGIYIGRPGEVRQIIADLGRTQFSPGLYNVTALNCNHFSDSLVFALLGQHIPAYINRMADIGSYILPSSATSSAKVEAKESFPAPGIVNAPANLSAPSQKAGSTGVDVGTAASTGGFFDSIFSFFGSSTTSSSCAVVSSSTSVSNKESTSSSASAYAGGKKKELSEKQREALAKLKNGNSSL